jgi:hypothetical protein
MSILTWVVPDQNYEYDLALIASSADPYDNDPQCLAARRSVCPILNWNSHHCLDASTGSVMFAGQFRYR